MKPHLPAPEVSAVRDEPSAPATAHYLPSDDRATAAAAATASDPIPSTHPVAAASGEMAMSAEPVRAPLHEAEARDLNGSGIAGTTMEDQKASAIAPPQSDAPPAAQQVEADSTFSASDALVSAPGSQNPYNATEERDLAATSTVMNGDVVKTEVESAPAPPPLASATAPSTEASRSEDVEMQDATSTSAQQSLSTALTAAKDDAKADTPASVAATGPASNGATPRDSTPVDGAALPLAGSDATEMSANQIKACQNAIKGLKGRTDSSPFHFPVDPVALNIPHYTQIIATPMDLGTIDIKLALTAAAQKGGSKHTEKTKQAAKWHLNSATDVYRTLDDFERDVRLVFANCIKFNGPDHILSQTAKTLDGVFEKQIKSIASSIADDTSVADISTSFAASRRPSEAAAAASRPKREVHPPPPKDLPYADRPQSAMGPGGKRKKSRGSMSAREAAFYDRLDKDQLKFCLKIVDEFHKSPLKEIAWVFFEKPSHDLDFAQAYYNTIKQPISLKEIRQRIVSGEYEDADGAKEDMQLMFNNCFTFNEKGSEVHAMGQEVKKAWDAKIAKMPRPAPPIFDDDEDEEDEDLMEDDDEDNEAEIQSLRDQIATLNARLERLLNKARGSGVKKAKKRRPSESAGSSKKAPAAKKAKSSSGEIRKPSSSKPRKSDSVPKKRDEEVREVTYEQKEELAMKITQLPDDRLDGALKIIAEDKPPSANDDEEIELDIDDLSPQTLYKLYRYVVRPKGKKVTTSKLSSSDGRKRGTGGVKRKNLDESEEAARIARLQAQLDQFDNNATGTAPSAPAAGHDDLVASESSSGEEDYDSESDYE
jgi:bromodomain-containing factor 1